MSVTAGIALLYQFGFLRFLAYPGYLREVTTFQVFGSQRELAAPIAWHQSNIATSLAEASHLQHLDLSSNLISRMCDLQPHIPWNRLRSFSGPIDFTPTNPKALAFDWTGLENLILLISSTRIPWVDNITIFKPVPRLKTLEIRLRDDGMDLSRANTTFGYFHCDTPSIEQLTLRGFEVESGSEHLFTLIQQNKDTLCRLFLDDTFVKDMEGLLEAAPSLTHLSFNHRALTTSNSQGVIERLRNLTQLRALRYTAPFYFAIEQLPELGLLDFVKERRPELNAECMLVASKRSTIHDTDSNSLKDAGFKVTVVFK
ncbi:hypothetical protein DL96DRAFT_1704699 [Flagelloscypha sp. PMI_526]|nr:hypothetical protein DL96DRAFT_1704699 [Flagelloscypha sp. PMI_526]